MFVAQLWRHPVKSLGGERVDRATVTPLGVEGDRVWGVRDGLTGTVLSAKRVPELLTASARWTGSGAVVTLAGGSSYEAGDPALDLALTEWLDRPVSLISATERPSGEPFFDARPLHLLTTATLRAAAARHPGEWDPRRFRANVLVDAGQVEDGWTGATLGAVDTTVDKRTIRCVMTSAAQPGLAADPMILRSLPDKLLGVYASVLVPGEIAVGDPVVART